MAFGFWYFGFGFWLQELIWEGWLWLFGFWCFDLTTLAFGFWEGWLCGLLVLAAAGEEGLALALVVLWELILALAFGIFSEGWLWLLVFVIGSFGYFGFWLLVFGKAGFGFWFLVCWLLAFGFCWSRTRDRRGSADFGFSLVFWLLALAFGLWYFGFWL